MWLIVAYSFKTKLDKLWLNLMHDFVYGYRADSLDAGSNSLRKISLTNNFIVSVPAIVY